MYAITFIRMCNTIYDIIYIEFKLMQSVDFYFLYKYSVRSLLISKLNGLNSTYTVPQIMKMVLYFSIRRIEDIDTVEIYNYLYLFKFFFGKCAFLTKYKSFFNLGKWTHSFYVTLIIRKKDIYNHLFFIINDLFFNTDRSYWTFGVFSTQSKIFYLILKDLNIFSEKKTNLGLFYLKHDLNFKLYCTGYDIDSTKILLSNLNLIYDL